MALKIRILWFLLTTSFFAEAQNNTNKPSDAPPAVTVSVFTEHYQVALEQLQGKRPCYEHSLFGWPHIGHMEIVLVCHALYFGGLNVSFEVVPVPNHKRAMRLLQDGSHDLFVGSMWSYLDDYRTYQSLAVIEYGEFEKGLYTAPGNHKALASETVEDLKGLTAIVGPTWNVDRALLDCLGITQYYVNEYPQMLKVVSSGRSDFILQSFANTDDLALRDFSSHLVPIKGLKFILPDSLHFYTSKRSGENSQLHNALNKGLEILKESGDLRRAYESVGFYNANVQDWDAVHCNEEKR